MSKLIFVQDIDLRSSPKVRHEIRQDAVSDYAALYKENKKQLPPIVLFTTDNRTYILADGAHRLAAQVSNGAKAVVCDVHKGDFSSALEFALKANERHGIRRSREDKRQCVAEAIKQWPELPNVQIAERCMVDDKTVKSVRDGMEHEGEVKPVPVRVSADGKASKASKPRASKPVEPPKSDSEIRVSKPAEPEKLVDSLGRPIPKFCTGYWKRIPEVKDLLNLLSEVMTSLKRTEQDRDPMYAEVNIPGTLADLNRVWASINTAIPYAVCTQCQGHPEAQPQKQCRLCKNKGLISKYRWDVSVPSELKNILKKSASA